MSVTLRDVARRCKLSPSTVSGVLNNRSTTWASDETRRRVFEAAESLGYRPNHAARALRTGKTQVVSFLFHARPDGSHHTFDGAAEIMASLLGRSGYELNLHVFESQAALMRGLENLVRRRVCDAVILFGRESDIVEQGCYLEQHELPFVVKGRHEKEHPQWYQVDYDHEGMMHATVSHLAALGHRRIAYMGYDHTEVYQYHLIDGFRSAMQTQIGKLAEDCIVLSRYHEDRIFQQRLEHWFTSPWDQQPTAFAMGTGQNEWRLLEKLLAKQGRMIRNAPPTPDGPISVAGQAGFGLHLAFGDGHAFSDISFATIAKVAIEDLLMPLLMGDTPMPVQRILPPLVPVPTYGLNK